MKNPCMDVLPYICEEDGLLYMPNYYSCRDDESEDYEYVHIGWYTYKVNKEGRFERVKE